MAGGTITINPSIFTNQGTTQATAGTLTLAGAWSNGATVGVSGGGTLNLGGSFTTADVATFSRNGGTVNLTGTLDNTGTTLALNAATGSWNLVGGTLKNGTLSESGGAELVFTNSRRDVGRGDGQQRPGPGDQQQRQRAYRGWSDVEQCHGVVGQCGRFDLRRPVLRQDARRWAARDGGLRQERQQLPGHVQQPIQQPRCGDVDDWPGRDDSGQCSGHFQRLAIRPAIVNQGTIAADDSGGASSFAYDTGFSNGWTGSTADAIDTSGVSDPAPQAVYQTWRTGDFTYALGNLTPGASYTVRLRLRRARRTRMPASGSST